MGRFSDAETLYKRSSLLDPERSDSQVALLRLRCWREEYKEVKRRQRFCCPLMGSHPNSIEFWELFTSRRMSRTRSDPFRPGSSLRPGDPETLFWRAELHLRGQEWEKAIADIERASVRSSTPAETLLRIVYRLHSGKLHFKGLRTLSFPIRRAGIRWAEA